MFSNNDEIKINSTGVETDSAIDQFPKIVTIIIFKNGDTYVNYTIEG